MSTTRQVPVSLSNRMSLLLFLFLFTTASATSTETTTETTTSRYTEDVSIITLRERCMPHGVHLAYGNTTQEMVIVWCSAGNCSSYVEYGESLWNKNYTATETTSHFPFTNQLARHYYHHVVLTDLVPNTTYYYSIVNSHVVTATYYFKTPPSGNDWSPSFILYGDLGVESLLHPVLTQAAMSGQYSAFFHVGDIGYDLEDDGGQRGDTFMDIIEDYAKYVPYMTAPGNHEINNETFYQYRYRFSMPGTSWPMKTDKLWYSFDIGPIHFISYSTEVFFVANGKYIAAQSAWLIDDLDKANKQRHERPWIIALGHRPMYCSNSDNDDCTYEKSIVREQLENIFYIAGIDVIFGAHEHSYERLYPVYNGNVVSENYTDVSAPIHIVTGAAGNKWGPDPMDKQSGNWTAFRQSWASLNSYGRFTVFNSTHMFWEQIQNGTDLDSVWIIKEEHVKNNVSKELQQKVIKSVMEKLATTTKKTTKASAPEGEAVSDGDTKTAAKGSKSSVSSSPFLKGKRSQTLIICLSAVGGLVLILITILMIIRNNRNKMKPVSSWNEAGFVKRSFYRNIKNLENELMTEELDMNDGSLPTSKLLSENMDI